MNYGNRKFLGIDRESALNCRSLLTDQNNFRINYIIGPVARNYLPKNFMSGLIFDKFPYIFC